MSSHNIYTVAQIERLINSGDSHIIKYRARFNFREIVDQAIREKKFELVIKLYKLLPHFANRVYWDNLNLTDDDLKQLLPGFLKIDKCHFISLTNNEITDEGINFICYLLTNYSTIYGMNLYGNKTTEASDKHFKFLSEIFEKNRERNGKN